MIQIILAVCAIFWPITNKDLFNRSHNPSHSTLYQDGLKIKTIIVEKQNFAKMPFVYYLIYKSISDNSAAWTSHRGSRVVGLWICKFVNNKQIVFIFKTSGYNVECDGLWDRSNRSLVHICIFMIHLVFVIVSLAGRRMLERRVEVIVWCLTTQCTEWK